MRFIYLIFLCLIFSIDSVRGQSLFDKIKAIDFGVGGKYAFVKFSDEKVAAFSEGKKKKYTYCKGAVLLIPVPEERTIQDTVTFELEYNSDSTMYRNKSIHSFPYRGMSKIIPSFADSNCLNVSTGNKAYQIRSVEIGNVPLNMKIGGSQPWKEWNSEIRKDTIVEENTILIQPELKWLSWEDWSPEGKTKVEAGIMDSAFKDEEGNFYILFEEGYYSDIRRVLCTSCGRGRHMVEDMQKELLKRGYKLSVNNQFDKATKAALTEFQKANNLPVGVLNMETIKALGVTY